MSLSHENSQVAHRWLKHVLRNEVLLREIMKGKAYRRRQRLHMLSDITSSAKYPEVKRAAQEGEGWTTRSTFHSSAIVINTINSQLAQLSQRDCAAGWVSFGQKWKRIFCRQYRYIFNHCDVIGLQSYQTR